MKKFIRISCTLLSTFLILGSVLSVGFGFFMQPMKNLKMDLAKLPTGYNGAPAKLYAQNPQTNTWELVETSLPTSPQSFVAVKYGELSDNLINAFVAIEDKRFYLHHGVDLLRTGHACTNYLLGKQDTFGGSTITQQLIKNITSQTQRTPQRKITEMFYAMDLESHLDKQEIMEAYLNVIALGHGCRGVGAAARYYFGKEIQALSLPECASIAAITNNPSYYDPLSNPTNHLSRRNIILDAMCEQGYISPDVCASSKASPLCTISPPTPPNTYSSWYADMVAKDVIHDLQHQLGYTYDEAVALLYHGDLRIETAMDVTLQNILSAYYQDISNFPVGEYGRVQSGMLVMDPYTGAILAVAGAVGEKCGSRVQSFATDTQRPVGSAIKPLSVYAPALMQNPIDFASVCEDTPVKEQNGIPWPRNADGLYRGKITVAEGLARSSNTVAVKLLEEVGQDASFDFLKKQLHMDSLIPSSPHAMGDTTISSLALGQQTHGLTLRELVGGYTICYEGMYLPPHAYHRVISADGEVLLSNKSGGHTVLSPEKAIILRKMLEGVVTYGTASSLTLGEDLGISVAGKTGTTQNNCDKWFVGMTPHLMAGVWVGYPYPQEMRGIVGNPALDIFDHVMHACLTNLSPQTHHLDFPTSPHVLPLTICPRSGKIATSHCQNHLTSALPLMNGWFEDAHLPHEVCDIGTEDT